jgi:hypothetical protein
VASAEPSGLFDLGATLSGGGGLFDSSFSGVGRGGLFNDASFSGVGLGSLDDFGAALLGSGVGGLGSSGGLGLGLGGSLGSLSSDEPLGSGGLGGDELGSGGLGRDVLGSDDFNLPGRAFSARSRRTFASDEPGVAEPPPGL